MQKYCQTVLGIAKEHRRTRCDNFVKKHSSPLQDTFFLSKREVSAGYRLLLNFTCYNFLHVSTIERAYGSMHGILAFKTQTKPATL